MGNSFPDFRVAIWYSSDNTGFSGGGATSRPTAADEQFLNNETSNWVTSNNPPSPYTSNPDAIIRELCNFWIGDVDEGYSFAMDIRTPGAVGTKDIVFMDSLLSPDANQDADPTVSAAFAALTDVYDLGSSVWSSTSTSGTSGTVGGWFRKTTRVRRGCPIGGAPLVTRTGSWGHPKLALRILRRTRRGRRRLDDSGRCSTLGAKTPTAQNSDSRARLGFFERRRSVRVEARPSQTTTGP